MGMFNDCFVAFTKLATPIDIKISNNDPQYEMIKKSVQYIIQTTLIHIAAGVKSSADARMVETCLAIFGEHREQYRQSTLAIIAILIKKIEKLPMKNVNNILSLAPVKIWPDAVIEEANIRARIVPDALIRLVIKHGWQSGNVLDYIDARLTALTPPVAPAPLSRSPPKRKKTT